MGQTVPTLERQAATTLDKIDPYHRQRYEWASAYVTDKTVLDAACGCGYGTSMLADAGAKTVLGIDASRDAVVYARKHWARPNASFKKWDLNRSWKVGLQPEVVVSLETIEHLKPRISTTLRRVYGILPEDGLLVFSHPLEEKKNPNKYHHWFGITKDSVLNDLEHIGFKLLKCWTQKAGHSRFLYHLVVAIKTSRAIESAIRLDVGGALNPAPGFKVLDIIEGSNVDYVCPAWNTPLPDSSVIELRARHFLEHLTLDEAKATAKEWLRILQVHCSAEVTVPNIAFHAKQLLLPGTSQYVPRTNFEHALAGFYGWQGRGPNMLHRYGYTQDTLLALFQEAGFVAELLPSRECDVVIRATRAKD